ncbi:MAG: NAD(P)-binding domain-containing protein [Spirochaetota bacterium]
MFDWLIIGGGIHGVHFAISLLKRNKVPLEKLCIVDPHDSLVLNWTRSIQRTGMAYLRSPVVHNLDVSHSSLWLYAQKNFPGKHPFIPPYDRPSVRLFQSHAKQLIEEHNLAKIHKKAFALRISQRKHSFLLETTKGTLKAKKIVLALGSCENLLVPEGLHANRHVYHSHFQYQEHTKQKLCVIGSGLTAAQISLKLAQNNDVVLFTNKKLEQKDFDSDSCWLGPKCLDDFAKERDFNQRRQMIQKARNRGSLTKEIYNELLANDKIEIISQADYTLHQNQDIIVAGKHRFSHNDVIVCTGFNKTVPGGSLLKNLIHDYNPTCADCGFPIPTVQLQWMKDLYVMGPLAELQLGPAARNISGARMAAKAILDSV